MTIFQLEKNSPSSYTAIWCVLFDMQLQRVYSIRSKAIQACVDETSVNVSRLSAARDTNTSNRDEILRQLRKEQTKVYVVHIC